MHVTYGAVGRSSFLFRIGSDILVTSKVGPVCAIDDVKAEGLGLNMIAKEAVKLH